MFFEMNLAPFFGAFMTWGFLIAFLFNVFGKVIGFKDSISIIITALLVFMSYFFSDSIFEFDYSTTRIYLDWLWQDIYTITAIFICHRLFKIKHHFATGYVYLGLTLNGLMFYLMWLDIQVFANQEPWWFWTVYSFGINVVDYVMIITLIVGKDWLGLARLGRFIKGKMRAKKASLAVKNKGNSHSLLQA